MSTQVQIETPRFFLRQLHLGDIETIFDYVSENREFHAPFEPIRPAEYYTRDYWFKRTCEDMLGYRDEAPLRLYLFPKGPTIECVGMVSFNNIVRGAFQAATMGYMLAESAQGKGYMTEAVNVAIQYLFEKQNFHRIMANYMPDNQRSAKVLERLGFTIEGMAKDYLFIAGRWRDHVLTSLTNHNWKG